MCLIMNVLEICLDVGVRRRRFVWGGLSSVGGVIHWGMGFSSSTKPYGGEQWKRALKCPPPPPTHPPTHRRPLLQGCMQKAKALSHTSSPRSSPSVHLFSLTCSSLCAVIIAISGSTVALWGFSSTLLLNVPKKPCLLGFSLLPNLCNVNIGYRSKKRSHVFQGGWTLCLQECFQACWLLSLQFTLGTFLCSLLTVDELMHIRQSLSKVEHLRAF